MTKGDEVKNSNEISDDEVTDIERISEAKNKINNYVYVSMGVGLIPVPFLDAVVLTGVQLKMLSSLSKIFDIKFSENRVKSILSSLLGSFGAVAAAPSLLSLVRIIPVVGPTIGLLTMPAVGGATTYAVGRVFLQHFASGGTFLNFDPEKVREFFAEKLKEGKKAASGFSSSSAK
ncbi:MAG: YcjF family protein [Candidatus Anammoxibacter sp.]